MSKSLHVLLVEDSEDDAALLLREFHRAGYQINAHRVEEEAALIGALESQAWDV